MLVVDAHLLGWDGEAACFIDIKGLTFKFGEGGKSLISKLSSTYIGVEALIGSRVEVMIVAAANGAFEKVGIGVRDSGMIAVAG